MWLYLVIRTNASHLQSQKLDKISSVCLKPYKHPPNHSRGVLKCLNHY